MSPIPEKPRTIFGVSGPVSRSLPGVRWRHIGFVAGCLYVLFGAVGCQTPRAPSEPAMMVLHVTDREAFIDDALSLLRLVDVPPRYVERATGLIVSEPTTSAQWFEPWRVDAPGGYQLLESSLHTVRRTVTIRIEPSDEAATQPVSAAGGAAQRVSVRVDKERLNVPPRQVTTASGALSLYSARMPTEAGMRGPVARFATWVPLGRDPILEENLLARLAERAK